MKQPPCSLSSLSLPSNKKSYMDFETTYETATCSNLFAFKKIYFCKEQIGRFVLPYDHDSSRESAQCGDICMPIFFVFMY